MVLFSSDFGAAERRAGLLFLAPAFITYVVVILWPFANSLFLSLYELTLLDPVPRFTGLGNFKRLLAEPTVIQAWLTTLGFVLCTTALSAALGLSWALLMQQPFWARDFIRAASLLAWILPATVTAFLWSWILNGRYGILNALLVGTGILDRPVPWLSDTAGARAAIVIAKTWLSIPLAMTFFLSGLQSLSKEQLDAARVDGANNGHLVRHVVVPHLRPTLMIVMLILAIGNIHQFDVIFALTSGGPVRATTTLSVEIYKQAFENWEMGFAAAIGVVYVLSVLPPAWAYLRRLVR
ncbi:MAG: sugar ABC transporter permease [Alphaproteobacteria bacterium]|nr:sugar ABC transporter permease [Alphaproteobacteria bacterium]